MRERKQDQPELIIRLENDVRESTGYKGKYMKHTIDLTRELKRQW